jgi:hypothetical protein
MTKPRLPPGHRALLAHLIAGGLIQPDESGLAWVSATRSNGWFTNEAVARVRQRGFSHRDEDGRHRYKLVESRYPHKLEATIDTTPKPPKEPKEAKPPHTPRRPKRQAHERTERLT